MGLVWYVPRYNIGAQARSGAGQHASSAVNRPDLAISLLRGMHMSRYRRLDLFIASFSLHSKH